LRTLHASTEHAEAALAPMAIAMARAEPKRILWVMEVFLPGL
jgi:hypothetical protein